MKTFQAFALLFVLSFVAACGGGSSAVTPPPADTNTPAAIVTQPASQTVAMGASATFTVVATGTTPLSYTWTMNGSAVGGNTATYSTGPTSSADNGATIEVSVSNAFSDPTSSPATLTVTANAAPPSGGAISFVQATGANFGVVGNTGAPYIPSYQIQFTTPVVAGHTVDVALWNQGPSAGASLNPGVTFTDDQGNIYKQISQAPPTPLNQPAVWIYESANVIGTPSTITITPASTMAGGAACTSSAVNCDANWSMAAIEFSGATGVVDSAVTQDGTLLQSANSFSFGPLITHSASELVLAAGQSDICNGGAPSLIGPGNSWQQAWVSQTQNGTTPAANGVGWCFEVEYQIAATPGSISPTFFVNDAAQTNPTYFGAAVATQ